MAIENEKYNLNKKKTASINGVQIFGSGFIGFLWGNYFSRQENPTGYPYSQTPVNSVIGLIGSIPVIIANLGAILYLLKNKFTYRKSKFIFIGIPLLLFTLALSTYVLAFNYGWKDIGIGSSIRYHVHSVPENKREDLD
jgi:hypothetical protein